MRPTNNHNLYFQSKEFTMRFVSGPVFLASISAILLKNVAAFHPSPLLSSQSNRLSMARAMAEDKKKVVVIGNGMVGQRFMENMIALDKEKKCTVATFCEEKRAAYNRVKLTSYFETLDPSDLSMTSEFNEDGTTAWYEDNGVEIFLNNKAVSMDTETKTIIGESGEIINYDVAVLATGSFREFYYYFASTFFYLFALFQMI